MIPTLNLLTKLTRKTHNKKKIKIKNKKNPNIEEIFFFFFFFLNGKMVNLRKQCECFGELQWINGT